MSTCKDCVHYDVCAYWGNILDPIHGGVKCDDFKDKSRFVELPCKVGDTVYVLDDIVDLDKCKDCEYYYAGGMGDYSACERTRYGFRYSKCIEIKAYKMTKGYILEYLVRGDFGKTVFLTKAEAEAKLRELQNE